METPDYVAQLDAWVAALADLDEVPAIRGDRSRPPVPSWRGGTERFEIPADCIEAAAAFSRTSNTTLFTTLFSVFALLQHRYTGDPRVVTLTPAANRPFQAAEDIAGYFVNLIALATSVRDDDSFGSLVERMRDTTARAFAHQGVPLDAIVERLRARGGPQHDQFAQTAFAFQNVRLPAVRTASGTATPFDLDSPFARFDLYLSIEGMSAGRSRSGNTTPICSTRRRCAGSASTTSRCCARRSRRRRRTRMRCRCCRTRSARSSWRTSTRPGPTSRTMRRSTSCSRRKRSARPTPPRRCSRSGRSAMRS
ncbi:hxxPF-repeated domain protein [Burkholderia thailandensis]|uniref:HxxPF-repeated domain protein n=1 Tax=Burkholderia thailandensis TaxID=57975 RepID=A0AAW9CUR1_BURTH|nr:hxxPF-repeated domain protein [Burkholderia thailandensis]